MTTLVEIAPDDIETAAKRKTGRPTKVTPETLAKLERAWLEGANDVEACFIAGIAPSALYAYQEKNPEYTLRKDALKNNIAFNAKKTIGKAIKRDPHLALDVVSRLQKDQWSLRTELTGAEGKDFTFRFVSEESPTQIPDKT